MAWTYSDWRQQGTAASIVSRGRLHLQEIADKISSGDITAHGYSRGVGSLERYYESVKNDLAGYEAVAGSSGGGNVSVARFNR